MGALFEIKDVDRKYYEEKIKDFLPDKFIDIHAHLWLDKFCSKKQADQLRTVTWTYLVAIDSPIDDLIESYQLMFPGKEVAPMVFSLLKTGDDIEAGNTYVSRCAQEHDFAALIFASPQWSAQQLEEKIIAGNFIGAKSYLSMTEDYIPKAEIRIFDFLPHHHLEVLNKHGWMVMLHIPRDGRLKDPVNLAQMLEIERRYPNVKVIIAHVGRAYCIEDVGNAFEVLAETKNMMFDITANTNADIFEMAIKTFGPKRIMFGSDLPITRMRMKRICENGMYINLVPKGLYGDVSGDKNMGELEGSEADELTFFMYEEIYAFRRAAEATGLSRGDVEDVFCNNAKRIIESAKS